MHGRDEVHDAPRQEEEISGWRVRGIKGGEHAVRAGAGFCQDMHDLRVANLHTSLHGTGTPCPSGGQ